MLDLVNWSSWLGVFLRRMKWPLILLAYVLFVDLAGIGGFVLLALLMGASAFALHVDKEREIKGADDFWGENLFFRYGERLSRTHFSIPVKPDWTTTESAQFAETLRLRLAEKVRSQVPEDVQVVDASVAEGVLTPVDRKVFLKIIARSRRGSQLVHFVHYAPFGGTITAHYFTYIRGKYHDWDVFKFIAASPFTMWVWGFPWLLNRHSISAQLSHFRESSFDVLDLQTILSMTHYLLWSKTQEILKEAGLLTERLMQVINNNISQSFSVNGSNNQFSNISQATATAESAQKAA
jgi:hypothetical protein